MDANSYGNPYKKGHPMEVPVILQEVLGVDKKNPHFTICKHPKQPGKLLVYFGAALLEVVDDDREHPSFKLLLARLYNSGLKVKSLTESFCVPYSTLKRWGYALKSGDTEKLIQVLAGRQHPRKLTAEILSFAQQRFNDIYPEDRYTYSKRIREEILEVFDVSISGERLRPHFTQWKQPPMVKTTSAEDVEESDVSDGLSDEHPVPPRATPESGAAADADQDENDRLPGQVASDTLPTQAQGEYNRKQTVDLLAEARMGDPALCVNRTTDYQFCYHAGILLFSAFLNSLGNQLGDDRVLIKQWLATVLLGAINIEQSKLLSWDVLRRFLGDVVVNLNQQRQALGELAAAGVLQALWRINGDCVDIRQCSDFYYDPHSKHYTGAHKILKGWCSRLRFAEKVLHMDFIHTDQGFPVYVWHDDNFHDLRQRFFEVVIAFRLQFDFASATPLTFVVDRGIYGLDVFKQFIEEEVKNYFVTWEKGYQGDLKKDREWKGDFNLYKGKNSSKDLKRYHFQFTDDTWPRQTKLRRLIVRATNPRGNTIEVSILANDMKRPAEELIELMFSRWLQENDFKYLDVHFGINEITSYSIISYKELTTAVNDKQIKSGAYKALEKQRISIKQKLKTRLLRKHCAKNKNLKRQQEIETLTKQLNAVEDEMAQTEKEVSRLDSLIEDDFHKLNTLKKSLMDGIKIMARNQFYLLFQPFKDAYDNYRDDHVLFRHLTRSAGLVRETDNGVDVLLLPEANFPPKLIGIIKDLLNQLNRSLLPMPDESDRIIRFGLLQNDKIQFEIKSSHRAAEDEYC